MSKKYFICNDPSSNVRVLVDFLLHEIDCPVKGDQNLLSVIAQACGISSVLAVQILQCYSKPSMSWNNWSFDQIDTIPR